MDQMVARWMANSDIEYMNYHIRVSILPVVRQLGPVSDQFYG